jgi:hypothetical protein
MHQRKQILLGGVFHASDFAVGAAYGFAVAVVKDGFVDFRNRTAWLAADVLRVESIRDFGWNQADLHNMRSDIRHCVGQIRR